MSGASPSPRFDGERVGVRGGNLLGLTRLLLQPAFVPVKFSIVPIKGFNMATQLALADQMTIEQFLVFADSKPNGEKWELVDGVPVMDASPTDWHQRIVMNIGSALDRAKLEKDASWLALLGIGTRVPVSPQSLPQPDLFVKRDPMSGTSITDDALILFEVLSQSNTRADQAWRKRVYASVPNCQHYVTVSMKSASATRHDRATGWKGVTVTGLAAVLQLPCIDATVPLAEVYRWTPIK
jgi:Uma2 family endonuclease